MDKEAQMEFLKMYSEESLPDYALARLHGTEMTPAEEEKCAWFCGRLLATTQGGREMGGTNLEKYSGDFDEKESMTSVLQGVEEKSLPEYALKFLYGDDLSIDEFFQCKQFCERLRDTLKT